MSDFTYDQIKPLIVSADVQGRTVNCQFALPGSDEMFNASAGISTSNTAGSRVSRSVQRTVANEVRRGLSRLMRGIFGGGILGRTARTAVNEASRGTTSNMANQPSRADKEAAIVTAFLKVAGNFEWNDASGEWTAPSAPPAPVEPTALEAQLQSHPVTSNFEKEVLARILARVAYADGNLAEEEVEFFNSFIPEEIGTVTSLAQADPVSKVEAEEIPQPVKETILLLAWATSVVDLDMDDRETAVLSEIAEAFNITSGRAITLQQDAKTHIFTQHITKDTSRDDLFALADKIGLDHEEAERALIRLKKRG